MPIKWALYQIASRVLDAATALMQANKELSTILQTDTDSQKLVWNQRVSHLLHNAQRLAG